MLSWLTLINSSRAATISLVFLSCESLTALTIMIGIIGVTVMLTMMAEMVKAIVMVMANDHT